MLANAQTCAVLGLDGFVVQVEVDWGDLTHEMLIGLRDNYEAVRAGIVRTGMDQTVVNLKSIAEGSGGGGMFGWIKKIFGS